MANTKPVRLSKAARDLNVGINTIVEFLGDQGIEVEARPTTKLEADVYEILLKEFQSDQAAKAQATSISNRQREMRETITLGDSGKEQAQPAEAESAPEVDVEALKEHPYISSASGSLAKFGLGTEQHDHENAPMKDATGNEVVGPSTHHKNLLWVMPLGRRGEQEDSFVLTWSSKRLL